MKIPTLVVLSGVPRSGKSLIAGHLAEHHDFIHVSADELREHYGMVWGKPDNRERVVNTVVHLRALEALLMQHNVVIDTTGMFVNQRQLLFDLRIFENGQLMQIMARKILLSLKVDEKVWEQRLAAVGRDTRYRDFFFGKFQAVTPKELQQLDEHLEFTNNTQQDLEQIKSELSRVLAPE